MTTNPITATVDFQADGVQHGFLKMPHSRDDSAWGALMIPITVAKNGDGPTALLTGANHGDEYEGVSITNELYQSLSPEDIKGQIIFLPAANAPAYYSGRRTSPLDHTGEANLNRLFRSYRQLGSNPL